MSAISITSTAPSFFNKLRGKSNPYEKTYRNQPNTTLTCQTTRQQPNARPENDLLAEARQATGRDPVTGRRRAELAGQTFTQQSSAPQTSGQTAADQKAAYLAWAAQKPHERGQPYSSYEEFVQEMIEKRDGRRQAVGGPAGYYAPERRVEEYYSEGVRH